MERCSFPLFADNKMKVALVAVFLLLGLMISDARQVRKDGPMIPRDEIVRLYKTMRYYDSLKAKETGPVPVNDDAELDESKPCGVIC